MDESRYKSVCNTGIENSGNWNSGNYNIGNYNSGSFNSGNFNSGNWNTGDRNTGIFNTETPNMRAFNKEYDMTYHDFITSLDYDFGLLCKRINDNKLEDGDIDRIKALPNFDAEIFKEITGIEVEE